MKWNNVLIALFAIAAAIPLWQYVNRRYLLKVGAPIEPDVPDASGSEIHNPVSCAQHGGLLPLLNCFASGAQK
jgi:hypothetical protein